MLHLQPVFRKSKKLTRLMLQRLFGTESNPKCLDQFLNAARAAKLTISETFAPSGAI